jgi:hypothetical protein
METIEIQIILPSFCTPDRDKTRLQVVHLLKSGHVFPLQEQLPCLIARIGVSRVDCLL